MPSLTGLRIIAAFFAAALCSADRANAQVTLVQTTNYYIVRGASLREIQHSVRQARPWKERHPAEGFTQWEVNWQYEVTGNLDGCRCTSLTTKTTVTITLPRWIPATNPPPALKAAWERYLTALARHEAGHAQFAVTAAAELHRRINALGLDPNCENLKKRISSLGRQILADQRKLEKEYDERTAHGAKEGVSLISREPGL
jgi:predicted secreted Zn-dependent protease